MKALIHLDQNGKKVMERRVHEAVMKERADISTALSTFGRCPCSNVVFPREPSSVSSIILMPSWTSTWNTRPRI